MQLLSDEFCRQERQKIRRYSMKYIYIKFCICQLFYWKKDGIIGKNVKHRIGGLNMNKIVCDMCGTSYPETASQCPICGNAKSENAVTPADSVSQESGYAYVKGGRFSHSNVRKRNNGQKDLPRTVAPAKPVKEKPVPQEQEEKPVPPVFVQPEPVQEERPEPKSEPMQEDPVPVAPTPVNPRRRDRKQQKKKERSGNIALVIIVVVLMLAILGVCLYIGYSWMKLNSRPTEPTETPATQTSPTHTSSTTEPDPIPCVGLYINTHVSVLNSVGQKLLLEVDKIPENTTDPVFFSSSDDYIATVDQSGSITAVAKGVATITVRCGEQIATFDVTCNLPNEPAYPTEPTDPTTPTTKPTEPSQPPLLDVKLEINRSEFTLTGNGSYHDLYKKSALDPTMIKWSSDDESVVQVTNKGRVIAVGNGHTWVYAQYGDQKVRCRVHVYDVVDSDYEIRTQVVPDRISTDITIKVGDTIKFYLVNKKTGERVDVTELVFKSSHPNFFTIDEEGVVTAIKSNEGYNPQYVMIEYEGKTYKCQLRVKN